MKVNKFDIGEDVRGHRGQVARIVGMQATDRGIVYNFNNGSPTMIESSLMILNKRGPMPKFNIGDKVRPTIEHALEGQTLTVVGIHMPLLSEPKLLHYELATGQGARSISWLETDIESIATNDVEPPTRQPGDSVA